MKKHLLLLAFVFIGISLHGQNSIPNGNFEQWNSGSCENPQYFPNTSNMQNFYSYNLPFNVEKVTDAYHGSYAIQVSTVANATDTAFGYFINIDADGGPESWSGGAPISEMPTGIRGYYKYNVATADSATLIVNFSKAGVNIGTYVFNIGGIHSTYTLFDFTFNPALVITPDSVGFAALSCKFSGQGDPNGPAGSILILDSLSLKGISSQPAEFDGDYESWQAATYYSPINWYFNDVGDGFNRTIDAASGNYAVELTTFLSDRNGHSYAESGRISTGYYDNNCNNNCIHKGGSPFTNQIDTLTLYYKYIPSGNDSASVNLSFKKDGIQFYNAQGILKAAPTYTYLEIPFDCGQTPDSVIIDIMSSYWSDTLVSFVGSQLIIDSLKFKPQSIPTGLSQVRKPASIKISPNPSNIGTFFIQGISSEAKAIEVFNSNGIKIYSKTNLNNQKTSEIDLSSASKGIYFIKIYEKGRTYTQKVIML